MMMIDKPQRVTTPVSRPMPKPVPPPVIERPAHPVREQMPRSADGRTDGRASCPADMSGIQAQVGQLARDIKVGRVVRVFKERTRHGFAWVFPIEGTGSAGSAGDAPPRSAETEPLTDRAVRWMIEFDQLARRPFFEACPWANRSCSLHDRALKRIARVGLSEKVAGVWVLKDHARALAWLKANAEHGGIHKNIV